MQLICFKGVSSRARDVDELCIGAVCAYVPADSNAVQTVRGDAENVDVGDLAGGNTAVQLVGVSADIKYDILVTRQTQPAPYHGLGQCYVVFLVVTEDNGEFILHLLSIKAMTADAIMASPFYI